ncbi:type VI secretion system-associated FHA domain protein [Marinomonas posidonica]|uniref:FHA domain containing protein n=1 Tax=Marinomonas posidonica (strain CECT 7376 / NCIMB 14433 / IVIA-Po-181) TaxID=491952 RepID=F6D0Z6_MARPP|nr:FHA domain-containing protein [Marinomonas posidonica]AEF53719.1 FHA domain containing protein [Marinomonas posidonica IVIA-Po-181]
MSISLQLVELPENEQVTSRQISLPDSGGTIGRSFDCTIQLPDFNRSLSRVHAEIVLSQKGRYQLIDRSTNGVYVNGRLIGKGAKHTLADGDNIKMGAYTLLVSDMESLFVQEDIPVLDESLDDPNSAVFDVKNLEMDSPIKANNPIDQKSYNSLFNEEEADVPSFSKKNVMEEDSFGYDPFESMQEDLQMRDPNEVTEVDEDAEVIQFNANDLAVSTYNEARDEEKRALHNSVMQLNKIIEQQQNTLSGSIAHERLMSCLEATFEKFIAELSPVNLEDEFNSYLSGWGAKDKKYWSLYKKQFIRKQERGEYYRQFYALLFEELREKR